MTPEEAIYILKVQTRRINTTADAHDQMRIAIDLLEKCSEKFKELTEFRPEKE